MKKLIFSTLLLSTMMLGSYVSVEGTQGDANEADVVLEINNIEDTLEKQYESDNRNNSQTFEEYVKFQEFLIQSSELNMNITRMPQARASTNHLTGERKQIVDEAYKHLGKPYTQEQGKRMGPYSFDCSGLTYYVFKQVTGRNIGEWTVPQETSGTVIPISSAKPGDLLFWGNRGNTHHVAIYIGNNQYIHAPTYGETVSVSQIWWDSFPPSFALSMNLKEAENYATIVKNEVFNKNMKVADPDFNVYTEPYNTSKNARIDYNLGSKYSKGQNVEVTNRVTTSEGVVVYKLKSGGYVGINALEAYATVTKSETITLKGKIVNTTFNIYDKPYNTSHDIKLIGSVSEKYKKNEEVAISKKITTSDNISVYQLLDGGYVSDKAIELVYHSVVKTEPINNFMKVEDTSFNVYSKPYNTSKDIKLLYSLENKYSKGQAVEVIERVTTSEGVVLYKLKDGGYVGINALKAYAAVTKREPINNFMKVEDTAFNVYSEPYNTSKDAKVLYTLGSKFSKGQAVEVTERVTTSEGVIVYKLKDGGYVGINALKAYATVTKTEPFVKTMKVEDTTFNVYSEPYNTSKDDKVLYTLGSKFSKGQAVEVTERVTTSEGVVVYKLKSGGYVGINALKA